MTSVNWKVYEKAVMRMAPRSGMSLVNACLGLAGDAGECANIIKKYKFQGHSIDYAHMAEMIGGVLFYATLAAHQCGITLEDVARKNIEKRMTYYPDESCQKRSSDRDIAE